MLPCQIYLTILIVVIDCNIILLSVNCEVFFDDILMNKQQGIWKVYCAKAWLKKIQGKELLT